LTGGSQERRRRGGQINVPVLLDLQKHLELAIDEMDDIIQALYKLRKLLLFSLVKKLTSCNVPQLMGPIE